MKEETTPTEVRLDRDNGRVLITWEDGARLQYPLDDLHNACPSATCRGHSAGEVEPPNLKGANLLQIEEVGNYALRFIWAPPGCNHGIYTWPYLRELGQDCPA